jgi:hypothetical protein
MMPTQITVEVSGANTHEGAGDLNDKAVELLQRSQSDAWGFESLDIGTKYSQKRFDGKLPYPPASSSPAWTAKRVNIIGQRAQLVNPTL